MNRYFFVFSQENKIDPFLNYSQPSAWNAPSVFGKKGIWGIFPVKAKYLVSLIVVIAALSAFGGSYDGVAHFAHLGGLAAGFIYLRADWRLNRYLGWLKKKTPKSGRLAVVHTDSHHGYSADHVSGKRHADDPVLFDRVDEVLDKISAKGMSSLTPEELKLLDRVSKQHRTN